MCPGAHRPDSISGQRAPEVLGLQFPQCLAFHVGAGDLVGARVCTLANELFSKS